MKQPISVTIIKLFMFIVGFYLLTDNYIRKELMLDYSWQLALLGFFLIALSILRTIRTKLFMD